MQSIIKDNFTYKEYGKVLIVKGDCMDVMKFMGDKSTDLAIIDPPLWHRGGWRKQSQQR